MGIVWHGMVGVSFCIKPGINYKMTDKHTAEYSNTATLGVYWHVCNAYIHTVYPVTPNASMFYQRGYKQ